MALAMTNQTTLTMNDSARTLVPSRARIWTGRVLSGLVSAFLLLDGGMKLLRPEAVVKATTQLGFTESSILGIGLVLVASTLFYIIPRTSVLGAILLTGYLGGAVATQVRAGAVPFNVIFPVVFGVIIWGGLWLRNERVRRALGSD
jgi:hypothetical protein